MLSLFLKDVYPELPDHPSLHLIQWTVEDDDRMEHWEQAIVNISWQKPHSKYVCVFVCVFLKDSLYRC